jgi:ATP-dependent helicase YprA (DUF1998 family)
MAYWGEVTAHFRCHGYEKVHFYSLDAISQHPVDLPTFVLETMAVWLVPPEAQMEQVRRAGLDVHSGLRGIGYATRMLLPIFMTCDTLDFSHSIGSVNSEWNAIFIYERYPHGLGFTARAYDMLHEILPAVLDTISKCPCDEGCPSCVGKPLRQYATWNVERGEASIPSKAAARMILERLLGDGSNLRHSDTQALTDREGDARLRLEQALRRRLERKREPEVFHPIERTVATEYPQVEKGAALAQPDVAARAERRRSFDRELRKRIAKHLPENGLHPSAGGHLPPPGMKGRGSNLPPTHFPGRPQENGGQQERRTIEQGDPLASRARKIKKQRRGNGSSPEG